MTSVMSIFSRLYPAIATGILFLGLLSSCQKEVSSLPKSAGEEVLAPKSGGGKGGKKILDTTVTDIDGNTYKTVTIGKQVWMAENLRVTKYNDGASITNLTTLTDWQTTTGGAWCYYENEAGNDATYGKLYNWYAVNEGQKLAPEGWHIPDSSEWFTLFKTLKGIDVAGQQMKTISGWDEWATITNTNTSGFSALPGGIAYRNSVGGGTYFQNLGKLAFFWCARANNSSVSPLPEGEAYFCALSFEYNSARFDYHSARMGLSVRCVKD